MQMIKEKIIKAQNISKEYSSSSGSFFKKKMQLVQALDNVSFEIDDGELVCLLGPNGAGKTTLIKILTLLLLPSNGTFSINGFDGNLKNEHKIKASIGAMLMGERGLYWKLTGRENLKYFYALFHQPKKKESDYLDYLINLMDLSSIADRPVETYSSGQKMKYAFLRTLVADPPILILDEPTVAMDVKGARDLKKIVKELHTEKKKTILYSTHIMSEVEELAERVLIIDKGRKIDFDTVDNLTKGLDQDESISIEGTFPDVDNIVQSVNSISGVKHSVFQQSSIIGGNDKIIVQVNNSKDSMSAIISQLIKQKANIKFIDPKEITIEDVFIARTGRTLSDTTFEV